MQAFKLDFKSNSCLSGCLKRSALEWSWKAFSGFICSSLCFSSRGELRARCCLSSMRRGHLSYLFIFLLFPNSWRLLQAAVISWTRVPFPSFSSILLACWPISSLELCGFEALRLRLQQQSSCTFTPLLWPIHAVWCLSNQSQGVTPAAQTQRTLFGASFKNPLLCTLTIFQLMHYLYYYRL